MPGPRDRLDALVGIRALAAWMVVFYHSRMLLAQAFPQMPPVVLRVLSYGDQAVDLFFVLSGFIIFINYHRNFETGFLRAAGRFYWNRLSRIYPLHLLMLGLYLMLALAFLTASSSRNLPPAMDMGALWQHLLLVHAWSDQPTAWNVPSWSISAEWFVYLLFPFIAIVLARLCRGRRAHLLMLGLVILLALVAGMVRLGALPLRDWPLLRAFCEFLLGALAGSLYIRQRAWLLQLRYPVAVLAVLLTLASMLLPGSAPIPFVAMVCFLSVVFLAVDESPLSRVLSTPALVYLGEISYSTYMVHYFVYDVFKAGWIRQGMPADALQLSLSFVAVLVLSIALHHAAEVPAQDYLRRLLFKRGARTGAEPAGVEPAGVEPTGVEAKPAGRQAGG